MKLINIIVLLIITFSLSAQSSDAIYHKIHKTYTLNSDGSYVFEYSHKLEYNSYRSFHRLYGETFVVYDPKIQDVKVTECKTTMADGKVVKAPQNAFNEILPAFAEFSGTYNHLRELVIVHTGLEIGAIVDLSYKINHKQNSKGFFTGVEQLNYSSPVNELVITFNVPADITLSFVGDEGERIVNSNDEETSYIFTYKNLKETARGILNIDESSVLSFNAETSLNRQFKEILKGKEKFQDVEYELATPENINEILSTYNEVVNRVRTIPVPIKFQQFPVALESEIEQRGSGTPIEKALLLRKKLLAKQIKASLAFSLPANKYKPAASSLFLISDIYVTIPHINGQNILLLLTHKLYGNELFANYQNKFFALDKNYNFIELSTKIKNSADLNMDISIEENKAIAYYDLKVAGVYTQWTDEKVNASALLNSIGKEQKIEELDKNLSAYSLKGFVNMKSSDVNGYLKIELPFFRKGVNRFHIGNFPVEGKHTIKTNYPTVEHYKYTLNIPDKYKIVRKPLDFELNTESFRFEIKNNYSDNKLEIVFLFNIKLVTIPDKDYNKFREALINISNELNNTFVIKKE